VCRSFAVSGQTLTEQLPKSERLLMVGDHTPWARPRAHFKSALFSISRLNQGAKPITIGHGYSTLGGEWSPAAKAGPRVS